MFTLLAPGNYSGSTCSVNIQTVDNMTCADLPDDPLPVQTIPLVLSSTTQPTSSHELQSVQLTTPLVLITTHSTGQ